MSKPHDESTKTYPTVSSEEKGLGPGSAGQSGDTQGLSDVEEAGRTMLENGFRHLPVVDGEQAVGIVSIRDVVAWELQR